MPLVTASLVIEGNAVNVAADAAQIRGARTRRRARLVCRVLGFGPGRRFGWRQDYQLPEIVDGDGSAALDSLAELVRQARVTPDEEQQLAELIGRFVDLTR